MNLRILNIIISFLFVNFSFGQTNLIIPYSGVEGINIIIDSTDITEVFKIYGKDYFKSEKKRVTNFRYNNIGLTFQINPLDKNQIVRSIFIESPFIAQTKNGIILNKSSMKDVWKKYGDSGCSALKTYAWNEQYGISYYIRKDSCKTGYDPNEVIYKIEIHNIGQFGLPSLINFEFNDAPIEKKLKQLISILQSSDYNSEELDSFWEKEKQIEQEPYGLIKNTRIKRSIEYDLFQENIDIRIVGRYYNLNIINSDGKLVYLKLSDQHSVLLEKKESEQIKKLLKIKKRKGRKDTDTFSSINFPSEVFTYGTFCGSAGTPPKKCQEMLILVNENKYQELSRWLFSMNPEIATYGYIGIDCMKRKGKEIFSSELHRMKDLSKSEIQLNTCKGCIIGETEKIRDVVTDKNLKKNYQAFQETGWMK